MVEIGKGLEVAASKGGEAAAPGCTRLRARGHTRPPRDELFRSKKYRPPVRTSGDLLLPLFLPPPQLLLLLFLLLSGRTPGSCEGKRGEPGGRRSPPPQSVQPSQPGGEEQRGSLLKARQERERERLRVRLRVIRRERGL